MVLVVVMVPIMLGMAALTIDVGMIYNTRADLQNAADSGSLAATEILGSYTGTDVLEQARAAAVSVIAQNYNLGKPLAIDPDEELTFGRVGFNEGTGQFVFTPTTSVTADAVRITVRRTRDSVNGPLPLYFAGIFGRHTTNVQASATAALTGMRDIAVVIDLSGSMTYDSDMQFYDVTQINLRDLWAALDGPLPSMAYVPGLEQESEYAMDTGPAIGFMDTWGDKLDPYTYDATTDPGLWYIPSSQDVTEPEVAASLAAHGYSPSQITAIMEGSSTWTYRAAVMIGVAEWTPSNASDTSISSSELTWAPYPPYRIDWTWDDYISWCGDSRSSLTRAHPEFRYRFGAKTFVNFLLDGPKAHDQTDLSGIPQEPLRSIKDGVQAMVSMTRTFDQMSLDVFGSSAHHELDLSTDRQAVADHLYRMQAAHYDPSTNIGAGIESAIKELTSTRARDEAYPMIVLMSDGANKTGPDPLDMAGRAADLGIRIYTVSVGYDADRELMQKIADKTGGKEFYAAGTPEEYTEQLRTIFRVIGGLGFPALIE